MTRKYAETTTIQTWPGGKSYTYRGDLHGPENQKSLRDPARNGQDASPWRKGTPEEWREIRIATHAELYGSREILHCDSALVDDLIKHASETRGDLASAFEYDQIENLYKDPSDWTLAECRDYLDDEPDDPNPWTMDRAAIVEALEAVSIECKDDEPIETLREAMIVNIDDETIDGIDTWRAACREHAQDNPAEVYEWWRVSSWLCEELRAIGEVVIDNGYGYWWGRTCTGQGWIMDGTLQKIAARHEREDA